MFETRAATTDDVEQIISIHMAAFPGFFLTKLGPGFLKELYTAFVDYETGSLFVAGKEDEIIGFAAGTVNPDEFFKQLRRRRWPVFILKALPGIIKSPMIVIRKLWDAIRYGGDTSCSHPGGALLSSLAIAPHARKQGIGHALVEVFCKFAAEQGKRCVYVITDKEKDVEVTGFYEKLGFTVDAIITKQNNRRMYRLLRLLDNT